MIAAFWLCNVWAEVNDSEAFYNYYSRNPDGTFILDQIDVSGIGVDLFSYKVSHKDNATSSITGYYYQSDIVKFIDTIMDNRIVKTEYFNRFNSSIYTRINSYGRDGFINNVTITQEYNKDSKNGINRIWIFFEKEPLGMGYNYYAIRVQESDTPLFGAFFSDIPANDRMRPISRYMVSEGKVDKNYQLLLAASKITTRTTALLTSSATVFEIHTYNADGSDYMLFDKHRFVYEVKKRVVDNTVFKLKKYHDIFGVREDYNELYMQQNEYEALWGFEGKDTEDIIMSIINANNIDIKTNFGEKVSYYIKKINYIKDNLYIEYYIDQHTLEETGGFSIFCWDEHIRFNDDGKVIDSTLDLQFDIFSDNNIFVNQYYDNDEDALYPRMKR
jgi:hypothetical protein